MEGAFVHWYNDVGSQLNVTPAGQGRESNPDARGIQGVRIVRSHFTKRTQNIYGVVTRDSLSVVPVIATTFTFAPFPERLSPI